uniref:Uncharacterized protein n=1 Tax=Cacopsylla melanoneura TaxID=428564 RepID=A0A8D9E955_9HEMI
MSVLLPILICILLPFQHSSHHYSFSFSHNSPFFFLVPSISPLKKSPFSTTLPCFIFSFSHSLLHFPLLEHPLNFSLSTDLPSYPFSPIYIVLSPLPLLCTSPFLFF